MAGPITWRNVDSPSLGIPGQSLLGAQQSINGAFDTFQRIIQQREAVDASNLAAGQTNLRQNFLDALQGARTEEELAALKASGKLDALRNDMSPQMRAQLLGKEDVRLNDIRQSLVANQEFTAGQAARAAAPSIDQVMLTANNGDFAGAKAMLANLNVPNKAQTLAAINALELQGINRKREDTKYANQQTLDNIRIADATTAAAEAKRQLGINNAANTAIADYQAGVATRQSEAAPLIEEFNNLGLKDASGRALTVPKNQDGSVNYAAIGSELRSKLDSFLASKNSYTLDELAGSDTAARKRITEVLRQAGATPTDMARLDPVLNAGLNNVPTALQGNDLRLAQRRQDTQDVLTKEALSQFVPLNDPAAANEVYAAGSKAIKERFGADSMKATKWIATLDSLLKNGIVATDEKGKPIQGADGPIKVIPSASTILRLIDSTEQNSIYGRYGNIDFQDRLREWVKDGQVYKNAGKAVQAGLLEQMRQIDPIKPK